MLPNEPIIVLNLDKLARKKERPMRPSRRTGGGHLAALKYFGNRWLPQTTPCGIGPMLRRSSAAVATSREGHRQQRSGRAVLRRA